jgi:hypothetical protein
VIWGQVALQRPGRSARRPPSPSIARDDPEAITAGSQTLGAPLIPLDEDLEVIGVEDGSTLEKTQARPLDPLVSSGDPLARPVRAVRVLRRILDLSFNSQAH